MSYREEHRAASGRKAGKTFAKIGIGVVAAILLIVVLSLVFGAFGFIMQKVDTNEVGLITKAGKPVELVGPGVYSRWGPFSYYDLELVDTTARNLCAEDPEVLTTARADEDPIRIGVKVCADFLRPGLEMDFATYAAKFTKYKNMYLMDEPVAGYTEDGVFFEGLFQAKAQQAMKSCIGEGTFFDAAVGQSRDATALCHAEKLGELFAPYGFGIANVTVPNIAIPQAVGDSLDVVAKAKFDSAAERELAGLARAQADRQQAEKEGQIRVAQAETQERLRQDILTAELREQSELAQLSVIEAQKANEIRTEELNFTVAEAQLDVAEKQAEINNANEAFLIALYADNPEYMQYLVDLALAGSFGEMDKAFLEVGTTPRMLITPDGNANVVVDPEG
jgi:hypothetical protein